jgi:hypothetical protein
VRLALLLVAACAAPRAAPVPAAPAKPTIADELRVEFAAADGHARVLALFSPS